jgi:hypothetical protein
MSNLLGQPFDDWVTKQIDVRQKSLGKYSTTQIQANLVKTPWIRLASSVNLEFPRRGEERKNSVPQKLKDAGLNVSDFDGVELAKKSILYGGVVSMTGEGNSITQNSSINNGNSPFNGAYGWGGIDERGYVPMPGITDVSVQYQNNGALSKATINIKCFSKKQFQIIDVLYLRPGYSLLLEFGHSTYLNNDGEYDSFENFSSQPLRTLFNPGNKTQYDIYREIKEARKEYDGNYEAVYGKITTFKWSFNTDGSYECQVTLTGMGDVIESLKVNISVGDDNDDDGEKVENDAPPLIANKDKSLLNKKLYNIFQAVKSKTTFNEKLVAFLEDKTIIQFYDFFLQNYPNPNNNFRKEKLRIKSSLLNVRSTSIDDDKNQSPQTYMTFGTLMAIIQSEILLHDNSKGPNTSIPLFRFDMKFDDLKNDENYILKIPGEFSSDPRICLIPYSNTIPPVPDLKLPSGVKFGDFKYYELNEELIKFDNIWNVENEPYVGRLAGILVNLNYIAKVLDNLPLDEENTINILDFLKEIIKGITQALGGINKINITVTEDGLVKFVEEIPQRLNKAKEEKQYARFNVFGVKPGIEGSFITSINLDAEIPSSYSTAVVIGSQDDGNQKSENAASFSNYNRGLKDRIIPEKALSTKKKRNTSDPNRANRANGEKDQDQNDEIKENFNKIWSPYDFNAPKAGKGPFRKVYDDYNWYSENIDTLTNLNTTHASLMLGMLTQPDENGEQQLQSPFFLPFNFSIEMEGLSGMVLYQRFKISEEILPPSYEKDGVEIQIKGINHTVNSSGWKTKLETLSVPAAKLSPIATSYPLNGGSTSVSDSLSPTSNSDFQGPTPNADKLRTVLTSLGYQEKGTEISNGGDITSEAADASISVFKTIKTELPNLQIKVTGGNDKFHQSLSYNSRHKAGRGIDFVISPSSQNDVDKVEKILQGYAAGSDGNFSFLNEYNNPTKAASGKHFHISTGKGTEGADNIKRAKQLAQEGKITVYNIA